MNAEQQRGAPVLATARIYGLPHHAIRRIIREGHVVPRAVGRRSIILFSEMDDYLKSLPKTKSPARVRNEEACHVPG